MTLAMAATATATAAVASATRGRPAVAPRPSRTAGLAAGLLVLAIGPAAAQPATYAIDPDRSFVHFEVLHFGTSTTRGRIGPFRGEVVLDRRAGQGRVSGAVRTDTVDTGLRVFDARLREPDLFASAAHPEAFFVAERLRFEGGRLVEVRGEFTLRGVSQPLSLQALRFACRPARPEATAPADAGETCGGDFEGRVRRSDFGMTFGLPFVADEVRLVVHVEGTRR